MRNPNEQLMETPRNHGGQMNGIEWKLTTGKWLSEDGRDKVGIREKAGGKVGIREEGGGKGVVGI